MPFAARGEKQIVLNQQIGLLSDRIGAEQNNNLLIVDLNVQLAACTNKLDRQSLLQRIAEANARAVDLDNAIVLTSEYVAAIATSIASGGELPTPPTSI